MAINGKRPLMGGANAPRQRRSQQTYTALLDAADAGFSTDGWRGTSVERVASAAGTSVGTVYSRFGSKRDLLIAVMAKRVSDITSLVRDPLSFEDPIDGVRSTIAVAVRRRRAASGLLQAWAEARVDHPELQELESGIQEGLVKQLRDTLDTFAQLPDVRADVDLDTLSIAVSGLLQSVHLPPWTALSDDDTASICTRMVLHLGIRDGGLPTELNG